MANKQSRFWRFTVILWLTVWLLPARAAIVGHYEECDQAGQSWSFPAIEAAGQTPRILEDLTRADLAGIDVLFVTNCSLFSHSEEFLGRLTEIHAAIKDGLIMVMNDRQVDQAATVLPGPGSQMQFVWNPSTDTQIQDNTTLVTNGPGGVMDNSTLDGGHSSNHGYVDANRFPAGVNNILSQTVPNHSVMFSYGYGKGYVVYSAIPLDFFFRFVPYCERYVEPIRSLCINAANIYAPNEIAYGAGLAQQAPEARIAGDITINEGQQAILDGSPSFDPKNSGLNFEWTQVSPAEPNNLLNNRSVSQPTFYAPYVTANQVFTYRLVVTNTGGLSSEPAYINVTVKNSNQPPVADAGDDMAIKAGATATLDASASYDPDNDPALTYAWRQVEGPTVTLSDSTAQQPSFVVPAAIGQALVFELQVSDGHEESSPAQVRLTVLDNTAPMAKAGSDMVKDEAGIVVLNGSDSYDSDGDGLDYEWQQVSGTTVTLDRSLSATPTFEAPLVSAGGTDLVFELTVTDTDPLNPKAAKDLVVVHVRNINDPPSCDLAQPSREMLWPPNHKMVQVGVQGISDKDSLYNQVSLTITGITQDEPVDGKADGHTSPDGVIQNTAPANTALLRAERAEHGNGRVYQINFEASDGLEVCQGSVMVGVPASRKHYRHKWLKSRSHWYDKKGRYKHPRHNHKTQWRPVDDGQRFDATEKVEHSHHHSKKSDDLIEKLKNMLRSLSQRLREKDRHDEAKTHKATNQHEKKDVSKKHHGKQKH
jgi:hypothetical protein